MDHFDKFLWSNVFESKDPEPVIEYVRSLFYTFGIPSILQLNNGGEFKNEVFDALVLEFKDMHGNPLVQYIHGRPYHPQSNGRVERVNKTIMKKFSLDINELDKSDTLKRDQLSLNVLIKNYNNTGMILN